MALGFYFDEDFAHDDRVDAARRALIDVLTPSAAGMLGRADDEQLSFAASLGRMIVTHNQGHFAALHTAFMATGLHHSGICIVRMQDWLGPGEIARRLSLLAGRAGNGDLSDQLLFLSNFG
jgi:hypothetical protein